MTAPQIASVGIVTIGKADDFEPFAIVHEITPAGGVTHVARYLRCIDVAEYLDAGYTLIDEQHLVTCYCGELISYEMYECRYCVAEARDLQQEIMGVDWMDDPRNTKCNGTF